MKKYIKHIPSWIFHGYVSFREGTVPFCFRIYSAMLVDYPGLMTLTEKPLSMWLSKGKPSKNGTNLGLVNW